MMKLTASTEKYLEAGKAKARLYQQFARTPKQLKSDERLWQAFSNYLGSKDPWNATEEDVAAWLANLAANGLKHGTLLNYVASLSYMFSIAGKGRLHGRPGTGLRTDDPTKAPLARSTLRGIRIVQKRAPSTKTPLPLSMLDRLIDSQPNTVAGMRNRALYAVGWTGALERYELLALDLNAGGDGIGFVEIIENGFVLKLHRWAGSRHGRIWATVCVPRRNSDPHHCAVGLLEEWLRIRDIGQGPLFPQCENEKISQDQRMSPNALYWTFRKDIKRLGISPEEYSLRSLRSGCLDWLAKEGVPFDQIKRHSRLYSVQRVIPYVRSHRAIVDSPFHQTRWLK